ncbi:MAG TPA: DnaB-like helicase N-terminal domain-containing protein, partial [bacterium]
MKSAPLSPEQIPHSFEAEAAVLGCLFLAAQVSEADKIIKDTLDVLGPQAFFSPRHRKIFDAIHAVALDGLSPDLVTVTDHLLTGGNLEAAGGPAYITEIVGGVFSVELLPQYLTIVRRNWAGRRLQELGTHLVNEGGQDPESLQSLARETLDG